MDQKDKKRINEDLKIASEIRVDIEDLKYIKLLKTFGLTERIYVRGRHKYSAKLCTNYRASMK